MIATSESSVYNSHLIMTFELSRTERTEIITAASAVGSVLAGRYMAAAYRRSLEKRLPEGGTEESIFPYLQVIMDSAASHGIQGDIMGGPAKQALLDPETTYATTAREIHISTNPGCRTRQKATLYRPGENTRRDADIFATKTLGDDGIPVPTGPEYDAKLDLLTETLQKNVDSFAAQRSFSKGPIISLFGYEALRHTFRMADYATNTALSADGSYEIMSHSLGARAIFPILPQWTLVAPDASGEVRLPTSAPARLLGRTLVRSLVTRKRDASEVYQAVGIIRQNGLYDTLLGDDWQRYERFRMQLDASFQLNKLSSLARAQGPASATQFLLAHLIAPLAPHVENSIVAAMIRDDKSFIGKVAARIMGAHGSGVISASADYQAAAA